MKFERGCQGFEVPAMPSEGVKADAMQYDGFGAMGNTCPMMPIYECPEEKVCHRYICYEVPHIKPCNTRIINHHVYRHTFTPQFTCCEENVVENVFDRHCC